MDNLLLDAETLFSTADIVDNYCARQRETINVYYAQIMALESEWEDDETFGGIVEEIRRLISQTLAIIEQVYTTYPKYFRDRAQQIIARPKFNEGGSTPIKVIEEVRVPSSNSQYYRDYSRGSYGGGYYGGSLHTSPSSGYTGGTSHTSTPHSTCSAPATHSTPSYTKTDSGYIRSTFAVAGNTPKLNSVLQSSFSNAPQSVMEGVYRTTNKLEFADSNKGSYYAPCGIGVSATKSVIAIDYNSSTLSSDVVGLVGQHVFYHADDGDYFDITEALKEEGNNPALSDNPTYQEYLNIFREGVYIPEGQNDERLSKKKYKTSARFFVECFIANVNQDEKTKAELKKLFPKSYAAAMKIIEKQTDSLTFGGN